MLLCFAFRWPIFISSGYNNDVRRRRINTSQFLISELLEAGVKRTGKGGIKQKVAQFTEFALNRSLFLFKHRNSLKTLK